MSEKLTCVFCGLPIEWGIGHRNMKECLWYLVNKLVKEYDRPLFIEDVIGCGGALKKSGAEQEAKALRFQNQLPTTDKVILAQVKAFIRQTEALPGTTRFWYFRDMLIDSPLSRAMEANRIFYAN